MTHIHPISKHLPPRHTVNQSSKTTTALTPGESIRIAGLGTFAIAAVPALLTPGQAVVPLGWERLAILAHPQATWDATSITPPIWRHRSCRFCGGSGRAA
ncbi:hypothetical protein [Sphaerisporangium fuscum]|uniref:hypothetical protein n=1 Tax=Sphaerisporangium fuscum TaxID=2835868 RepID=UPI001BDC0896|nr:hypothetical protein [Sphaerisporangium fuscum]